MIIDLSQRLNNNSKVYPNDKEIKLLKDKNIKDDGYVLYNIDSNLHVSTHIECPMHLIDSNKFISDYNLDNFYGYATIINCSNKKIINWDKDYDLINNKILLIYTGYDKNYNKDDYYNSYPVLSDNFINNIIKKGINLIILDTPSPDKYPYNIHKKLFQNNIFIIENSINLDKLLNIKNFKICAFPLKIDAEASFVRLVALIE